MEFLCSLLVSDPSSNPKCSGRTRPLLVIAALLAIVSCDQVASQTPGAPDPASPTEECPRIQIGCDPHSACRARGGGPDVEAVGQHQGRISFVCSVLGTPQPDISWSSDNEQQLSTRTLGSLSVLELERLRSDIHNTTFHCQGTNTCGTRKASIFLGVGGVAPSARAVTPRIVRYVGESATFRCDIDGYPSPIRHWTNVFEQRVVDDSRFVLQPDGSLQASQLTVDDNGVYFCSGENEYGRSSASVMLTVKVIPKVTVDFGTPALMACEATGTPLPFVTWYRTEDGKRVGSAVHEGQFFAVESTRKEDAGIYICNATNQGGIAIGKVELVVIGEKPTSDADPRSEVDVRYRQRVALSCGAVQGVPTPRITWTSLVDTPSFNLKDRATEIGSELIFESIQYADRGVFICTATNTLGNITVQIDMKIFDDAMSGPDPAPQHVTSGSGVELDCQASSPTNQPISYTWTWSSQRSDSHNLAGPIPYGASVTRSGKLRINSASLDHGGVFWCKAEDGVAVPLRRSTQLYIYGAPEVLLDQPETLYVSSGTSTAIPCYVAGYPTPKVRWFRHDGRPVRSPHRQRGSTLHLHRFSAHDAGAYTCVASNRIRSQKIETSKTVNVLLAGEQPRFFGDSFAAYPTIPSAFISFSLLLGFRTASPERSQLLLFNTQSARGRGKRDFVALFLLGGRVHAAVDAGHGAVHLAHSARIRAGAWYTVSIMKKRRQVVLNVGSGSAVSARFAGNLYGLNLNEPMYLGGYPDLAALKDITATNIDSGLVGCMQGVSISQTALDLRGDVQASHRVSQCTAWCEDKCRNGGLCSSSQVDKAINEVRCRCRAPYHGTHCGIAVDRHRFCTLDENTCLHRQCDYSHKCRRPPV
eukprot:scpid29895/ scgid21485/ Basement membrane-specific heparan sulfate proteoglycan core protein; Perlecan; Endorepellin; LG3 peptide